MVKTKVFAHKGIVGILSDPEAEGLIAKPGNGNLGCVCDASQVFFQAEAIELLKQVPKSHDDLGDVDVFKADDGKVIFAWMGGYMRAFNPQEIEGSRSYDASLLQATEGVQTPQDFIDFVEKEGTVS